MSLKQQINKLRPLPPSVNLKSEIYQTIGFTILGLILGTIAKMTDSVSFIGDLGTQLGVWIFIATLIGAYSHYPLTAGLNVFLFFLAMICSYFAYTYFVLGFFPQQYFIAWLIITIMSFFAGMIVWFSKTEHIVSAIVTTLPVSLLFASDYSAFYTYKLTSIFSLVFGLLLIILLPKKTKNKIISLILAIIIAWILNLSDLLTYIQLAI